MRAIDEFNSDHYDHSKVGFIGGAVIYAGATGGRPIDQMLLPPTVARWGRAWKAGVRTHYRHSAPVTLQGTVMSYQDRYPAFLRMMREWRHLKMLKRSGCGHDPAGVAATKEGECAVVCPACPQPDRNLPPGWEHAPVGVRYVCPQPSVRPSSLLFQDGYMPFFSQLIPISACSATIFPLT